MGASNSVLVVILPHTGMTFCITLDLIKPGDAGCRRSLSTPKVLFYRCY